MNKPNPADSINYLDLDDNDDVDLDPAQLRSYRRIQRSAERRQIASAMEHALDLHTCLRGMTIDRLTIRLLCQYAEATIHWLECRHENLEDLESNDTDA